MNNTDSNNGYAVLIGAGPGLVELFSPEGSKWLSRAEVVIYDRLANPELLKIAPSTAELIFAGKSPDHHTLTQDQINATLVEKTLDGKLVVRLKGGDPLIFGRGSEEADALVDAGVGFRIVPGITAAIAAASFAGIPLTDRRAASTLALVTGHEDPEKGESSIDFESLAGIDTVVFYMGIGRAGAIANSLIKAGRSADTPIALVENAARPEQRTVYGTLETVGEVIEKESVRPPALLIVGKVTEIGKRLGWYEKLPLKGKTVIVTRSMPRNSRLAGSLKESGARVIQAPSIEIKPPESFEQLDRALQSLPEYDWVVFTSPNGADGVASRLGQLGLDARSFAGVKLAAVGQATADAMTAMGLRADLIPKKFTTESLGQALVQTGVSGQNICLLRSDIAPQVLAETLVAAGGKVTDVTAYRTVRPDCLPEAALDAIKTGSVDWITFTSSSTVDYFLELSGDLDLSSCRLASIGPVTSETLRSHSLEPDVEADPHTIDALVGVILRD